MSERFAHAILTDISVCLKIVNFFKIILSPCSAHAGYIGTDRSLLRGHDALLLRHIARDLLHTLSHRHDYTWTAFVEPVIRSGGTS